MDGRQLCSTAATVYNIIIFLIIFCRRKSLSGTLLNKKILYTFYFVIFLISLKS